MTAFDWLLALAALSIRATIVSMLKGSSPRRIFGPYTWLILCMMESWLSPMYHGEVPPVSEMPVMPSSVCIFTMTAWEAASAPPDMTTGLANFRETGIHSILMIFMINPPDLDSQ